jgi:MFS family permease
MHPLQTAQNNAGDRAVTTGDNLLIENERAKQAPSQFSAVASAFVGWMFDGMDLTIFILILFPCVGELIHSRDPAAIAEAGGLLLALKLFAWGVGGIVFGIVADQVGRTRTMIMTILIYSIFTGLSGLAQNWWQLAVLQALAGVGIGGEWAAGSALVAETSSAKARGRMLQFTQLAFAFGFFMAAGLNLFLGSFGWRFVLLAGVVPALVAIPIRYAVPEPERWIRVRRDMRIAGTDGGGPFATLAAIFAPNMLRCTLVGVLISASFMIASWGGSTLLPTWINQLLGPDQARLGVQAVSYTIMLMNVGAVLGYLTLMWSFESIGRRWSYFLFTAGAVLISAYLFTQVNSLDAIFALALPYGYFCLGGFGAFACYLPELFPTRVRTTGQGFCWNMARFLTGFGPLVAGQWVGLFHSVPMAAATISLVFAVGLVAIWFGPETRNKPLSD